MCIYCTLIFKTMASVDKNAAGLWVVLYCSSDDSHVLVHDTAVVYGDKLILEDEVRFDYPGSKKLLIGVIKGFSDNEKEMLKLMDRLNFSMKPRREPSFHADNPRKAAVKAKQTILQKSKGNPSVLGKVLTAPSCFDSTEHDSSPESSLSSKSISGETSKCPPGNSLYNSKDDVNDSDSLSENELTQEEKELLAKLSAKKASNEKKRFRMLVRGSDTSSSTYGRLESAVTKINVSTNHVPKFLNQSKERVTSRSTSDDDSLLGKGLLPDVKSRNSPKIAGANTILTEKDGSPSTPPRKRNIDSEKIDSEKIDSEKIDSEKIDSEKIAEGGTSANGKSENPPKKQAESSDEEHKTKAPKRSRRTRKSKTDNIVKITYNGRHYNHMATDQKVAKLLDEYEVYILEKDLGKVKTQRVFSTVTAMARFLTRAVYTEDARNVCSVSGKPSLSKGNSQPQQRTMLDPKGVEAIIDFVTKRGERKNMKVPPASAIKQSMGNMLCEERPRPELTE